MAAHTYQLIYTPKRPTVTLRELRGYEELMIDDSGSKGVLRLLENILTSVSPDNPCVVEKIVIADRDFLLSRVYSYTYGSRIQSVLKCRKCASPFDLEFSLDDLVSSVRDSANNSDHDAQGFYNFEDHRFRLPDGEDELAVAGMPLAEAESRILKRCIADTGTVDCAIEVQSLMKSVAPLLYSEMHATCPECGESQVVIFDIQSFLLSRLKNERKRVTAEVHAIASAYHWSHQEILELPRSLRKTYAGMIGLE
jgi:hypothetical protein